MGPRSTAALSGLPPIAAREGRMKVSFRPWPFNDPTTERTGGILYKFLSDRGVDDSDDGLDGPGTGRQWLLMLQKFAGGSVATLARARRCQILRRDRSSTNPAAFVSRHRSDDPFCRRPNPGTRPGPPELDARACGRTIPEAASLEAAGIGASQGCQDQGGPGRSSQHKLALTFL